MAETAGRIGPFPALPTSQRLFKRMQGGLIDSSISISFLHIVRSYPIHGGRPEKRAAPVRLSPVQVDVCSIES